MTNPTSGKKLYQYLPSNPFPNNIGSQLRDVNNFFFMTHFVFLNAKFPFISKPENCQKLVEKMNGNLQIVSEIEQLRGYKVCIVEEVRKKNSINLQFFLFFASCDVTLSFVTVGF